MAKQKKEKGKEEGDKRHESTYTATLHCCMIFSSPMGQWSFIPCSTHVYF